MQVFVVESLYCRENATKKVSFCWLSVLYLGHNLGHGLGHPRILLALGYGSCLQFVRRVSLFQIVVTVLRQFGHKLRDNFDNSVDTIQHLTISGAKILIFSDICKIFFIPKGCDLFLFRSLFRGCYFSIISQWPPLSGPMRRRKPFFCNTCKLYLTPPRLTIVISWAIFCWVA